MEATDLVENLGTEMEIDLAVEIEADLVAETEDQLLCMMLLVINVENNAKFHLDPQEINLFFAVIVLEKNLEDNDEEELVKEN